MRAKIDSLNLSDNHLEAIFIHNEDYSIETAKSAIVFEPDVWKKTFGKPLTQNIIDAKIIDTCRGLTLPLKTFSVSPQSQTLEFAGLNGYNDRSEQLMITLNELKSQLLQSRITRIDIAIDFEGEIPKRVIKALSKTREPFKWKNTTYYKTAKEKKTNRVMDIKIYDKAHQAKLDYPLMRLEFVFRSEYLKKLLLTDLETVFGKMEKTIKRATGLSVKIEDI